jgi:hypothetical protein
MVYIGVSQPGLKGKCCRVGLFFFACGGRLTAKEFPRHGISTFSGRKKEINVPVNEDGIVFPIFFSESVR